MGLKAEQRIERAALATDLLKAGATNKEITDQTKAKFGIPIAASQLARIRQDLGLEVRRGRRPNDDAPVEKKTTRVTRTTAARVPKPRGNGVKDSQASSATVDGLLRQLMPAMKHEGISVLTLEARGKCVKEEMITAR
jgi:hypothetical protein